MMQLEIGPEDTDARERGRRRVASRRRWEDRLQIGIRTRALAIARGERPQEMDVLCPYGAGGWYCQWVAGHYGGCVMGRPGQQRSRRAWR